MPACVRTSRSSAASSARAHGGDRHEQPVVAARLQPWPAGPPPAGRACWWRRPTGTAAPGRPSRGRPRGDRRCSRTAWEPPPAQCVSGRRAARLPGRGAAPVVPLGQPAGVPVRLRDRRARRARSGGSTMTGSDGADDADGPPATAAGRRRPSSRPHAGPPLRVEVRRARAAARAVRPARRAQQPPTCGCCSSTPSTRARATSCSTCRAWSCSTRPGLGVLVGAHRRALRAGRTPRAARRHRPGGPAAVPQPARPRPAASSRAPRRPDRSPRRRGRRGTG